MDPISAFLSGPDKSDAAGSFLHSSDPASDFLTAPESVDEIHQRVSSMPSGQYSYEDAKRIYEDQQKTPLLEDVANAGAAAVKAVPAVVGDLGANIGKGAAEAYGAYADQGRSAAEVAAGLGLSTAEGAARQALDLGHAVQRGHQKASDAAVQANIQRLRMQMAASQPEGAPAPPNPQVDHVAQLQKRLNDNLQWTRMRQDMAEGKQGGWIDPTGEMTKNGMLYPGVSEVASTVVDPTMLVPGGAAVKAATTVGEKAVQGAIARAAGEGALTHAAEKVGSFAGKTADVATMPAKFLKKTADAALPETGIGTVVAAGPATAGAAVAGPARVIEKGADVVGQLGRTSGESSASRLTQLAMSETAPPWIRGAARHMARIGVDKGAAFAGDLAKSGATGAAVGGAIAAPGAENAEEVGGALGSGFGLGTLTHALLSPAIEGVKHRAAQDFDVLRWYETKSPEEQGAIGSMNLDRDQAIRLMTAETIANGFLDPNSNVRFEYQDPKTFEAAHGAQRAVAFVQSDTPTIIFNVGKMKTGTAYHELFHQLSRSPQIVDYGALTTKLLGVTDAAGNVVQPGLLGKADVSHLGDVYFSRLDPIGQKSVETEKAAYDANPNSPEGAAWTKRIVNEIGAELFANLARDTKGSLLEAIDKPTLKLVDSMTRGDRSQWVQNWGARLQQVLGAAPNAESDIFPGLKASPEIQSMLRDFVRAKRNLTKTPEFNEDNAEVHVVVNPRDAFRPGGDEIVKKFPDNDNFAKDAAGQPVYAGGRPVLLTESEIKKVQTNRAKEMSKVLESLPDTGEAGIMRPTAPVPVAPAPTPALPPGAVPATPKATRPVTKGTSAFTGKHFSDAQIAALEKLPDSVLTPSMKAKLKTLNDLAKQGDGSPILLFYNAALKNRRYSSAIRETARVITPIAMSITKAGNFTVTGLDITAFNSKLQRWFADKPRAFDDFNNSPDFFIEKTQQYLENHKAGQPGATGLDADAAKALRMRNRIQDFLNIRDIASESLNPDRLSKATDKDGLIRAFRFDRMNRVEPARGDKFPIDYEMVKRNYSPEGEKEANLSLRNTKFTAGIGAKWIDRLNDRVYERSGDNMRLATLEPRGRDWVATLHDKTVGNFPTEQQAKAWVEGHPFVKAEVNDLKLPPQTISSAFQSASERLTRESGQYSQLERVIDQKVQGDSIPAAQLAAMLRNPQSGVKADEIKWTGLDDFLKGKGRVTKQELLDFVRANRLQIEEKRLGEATQESAAKWTQEGDSFTYETLDKHLGQITLAEENNLRPLEGWEKYSVTVPGHGHRYFETLQAAKEWVEHVNKDRSTVNPTKYDKYTSPGGENYREILFRFPDKTQTKSGPMDHWGDERVFGHARVQDFDGGKTLLVDELQSDWHQRGRKEGYVNPQNQELRQQLYTKMADAARRKADAFAALKEAAEYGRDPKRLAESKQEVELANIAYDEARMAYDQAPAQEGKINEAPFSKTWHEFMVKRILRDAVEKGYTAVEWPDGATIAKRFNLNQHLSEIHYTRDKTSGGESGWTIQPNGDEGNAMFIPDAALADHVGEGVAERMREGEGHSRGNGDGWKILKGEVELDSGESRGMKTFYDDILPSFVNKYAKKWGAKVEDTVRGGTEGRKLRLALASNDYRGQHLWDVKDAATDERLGSLSRPKTETEEQVLAFARKFYADETGGKFPVHRLEITDAMRQDIKTKGQPLFSPDVTETPAFKNWFGQSKVVDSEGKPVVVYHGTGEKFTRFSKNKSTQGIFWFTNDKSSIEKGEAGAQGKGRTLDLFASIKNPAGWDEYHKYGLVELKSLGYDGAILPENDGTFTGFVFEPTQLKSASRNRGGFDPQNTSILMSPNVTAEQVRDLPADQFATESKTWKGGLTGQAIELGKTLKPEDLPKLQSYLDESRAKAQQIRKSGDLQGAMVEALRGQFFREASEAYRASQGEEGLSIRPEDLKTAPIGVKSEQKVVDNQASPDSIGGMVKKMFSPDEVQFKRVKPLPNSVGDENVPIVHFSGQHGLKKLDPAYMGKGMANSRDRRGGPKSFFFVAESPLGADEQFFGQGKVAYGAVVSGTRLYDLRVGKPDPLGFSRAINPLEAEETLASKGYAGVLVEGGKDDPRKTVILFKRAEVKEIPVKGPVTKAPRVEFSPDVKPSDEIRAQAAEYVKQAGIDSTPHQELVPVREDLAKRIADAFDAMQHSPADPAVRASYRALAQETKAQWNFITSKGVKMEPWTEAGQPYKNSAEMVADVRDNKHLWFFPTENGFGSEDKTNARHPMLMPLGVKIDGKNLVINDAFRAVHDYFGHAKEGFEFGPKGEYNAYLAHNQMFSDSAKPALAAETLAQNSWVNYGKHLRRPDGTIPKKGEQGFIPATERPYADQKAGLLPADLIAEANRP